MSDPRPTTPTDPVDVADDATARRRLPRRFLLRAGALAAAVGAAESLRPGAAEAAPPTTAWKLGGNDNVNTDGSNYLGPQNKAPLVFKTGRANGGPLERMRIAVTGRLGIGTSTPVARLDVLADEAIAAQGVSTADGGAGVRGEASSSGYGVRGYGGYNGVYGEGGSYGGIFYGDGTGSYGAYASGVALGVYGSGATGLRGSGTDYGVYGAASTTGVYGSGSASGSTGVYGAAPGAGAAKGVWGTGGQYGVYGNAGFTAGVRGDSGYVGVWGAGTSYGTFGDATATSGAVYGLFGQTESPDGYAMYAQGNARVTGTLSKAAGSFKIDHPLDPDNRWLSHSFVESPDMMNVYNGNVVLGADGTATVPLPEYFGALNRDFRYQLTCLGAHAPVYVAAKVGKDNRFTIAGGTAGLEVSWQVTGIRQDDYAKAHPIVVDTPKAAHEKGARQFVAPGSNARKLAIDPRVPATDPAPAPAALPADPQPHRG